MDQVGALCYQQLREISTEVSDLDHAHSKFQEGCRAARSTFESGIRRNQGEVANANKESADYYLRWNQRRPTIPPIKTQREAVLKLVVAKEKEIVSEKAKRAATKKAYDQDMLDFNQALKDVDDLKKIITGGPLANKQTSGNVAQQGFLEAVSNVKSDRMLGMTNRLTLGSEFLAVETTSDADPSGTDKIMNLLLLIRNEMWKEMDSLTKKENESIKLHKAWLFSAYNQVARWQIARANMYIAIGKILSSIGSEMMTEADWNMVSAKASKEVDRLTIELEFLNNNCNEEPPKYHKTRSNKIAEITTIEAMMKILRGLNWTGAVFSAISRISVGAEENPEAGFNLGFEMSVLDGLAGNSYLVSNKDFKDIGRVAVKLQIGTSWVWASFDAWTQVVTDYLIPNKQSSLVQQRYITNLVIKKSPSAKVSLPQDGSKSIAKGNVEFWGNQYGKRNARQIPHAVDGLYDTGDERHANARFYGCFQVHDHVHKQTVLAVNHLWAGASTDIGIGNNPSTGGRNNPDWTFAHNAGKIKARGEKVTLTWWFQKKGYSETATPAVKPAAATKPAAV